MRKAIAIIGGCCIIAALMVAVSRAAGVEEKGTVVEQRVARLETQIRQLMGTQDTEIGISKGEKAWTEGGVEPAGTATASDVLTGSTFHAGSDWELKMGTLSVTPSGGIIMYSGPWNFDATGLGTGPLTGWALCNGNNGTPDLSDRFIFGTVVADSIGKTGGSATHSHSYSDVPLHTHTINDPGHSHSYSVGVWSHNRRWGGDRTLCGLTPATTSLAFTGIEIEHTGTESPMTDPASSLPPYYTLAFIMKL